MIQGSKKVYLKGFNISLQFSYSYLECNSVFLYNFFSSNICEAYTDVESVNKKPNILKKQDWKLQSNRVNNLDNIGNLDDFGQL